MKYVLGIIQLALIVYICFDEYRKRSLSVFLWATLLLLFGITHTFTCFINTGYDFPDKVLNIASLFVILFCLVYIGIRFLLWKKDNHAISLPEDNKKRMLQMNKVNFKKYMIVLDILITVVVLYELFNLITYAGGITNTSWGTMRHSINNQYLSFSQIFTTLFFASSSCFIISLCIKNKFLIIYNSLLILTEVIISRNRIEVLPFFCSLILLYLLKINKLSIKQILGLSLMAFVVVYGVYALRTFRHYGSLSVFMNEFSISDFSKRTNMYFVNDDGELGLKKHFYYFINNENNFADFGQLNTYKRILLVWLPTKWSFGIKPNDFALSMGKALDPTIEGYSIHPTLFGDCYANMGFIGFMVLGAFWAIYVTILDRIIVKQKDYYLKLSMLSIAAISYVIIARGSVYNGFVWMFFGFIIISVINFIIKLKIK